ncbi:MULTISPECIES: hypothetical protein [Corynebacterium]|uniref:hypothetical protein n=1 Tax=Corynebacterium TaxID=1716 RepID=UPI0011CBC3A2|nr:MULTISPECIES: hypothetical protein [Corynebacterium]TXS64614.1 hypothetical protein CHU71_04315 [Corynebacterium sp. LK14]HAT1303619.1 hypothetical protein [Corynebacterium striatum]HAT1360274.1 hypothetical protein [Corynebacterium striatum]HAT1392320.1 hypothetical protein [Corynebacterium striatum]
MPAFPAVVIGPRLYAAAQYCAERGWPQRLAASPLSIKRGAVRGIPSGSRVVILPSVELDPEVEKLLTKYDVKHAEV